jgi:hypothetical protein
MMAGRFRGKVPEVQPFGDSSIAKVRMGNGEESSVAAEGGQEPKRRAKRRGKSELQSGDGGQPQGSSEVGGQSEAG